MAKFIMKDRISWICSQKELLEKERIAEVESSAIKAEDVGLKCLEAKGIAISRLLISEISTGLFGKPTVTLMRRCAQNVAPTLPSHSFSSGDIVGIWGSGANSNHQIASGVVSKLTSSFIQIALDDEFPELGQLPDDALVRIHKLANDVTYRRIKNGLEELSKMVSGPSSHLMEVLFKEAEPYCPLPLVPSKLLTKEGQLDMSNRNLDASQRKAVEFALTQKDLAVVHGPPGTGKTTTLVEIIFQHVKLGCKVLAVAPSNLAVDNLLERLVASKVGVVRVGHPARATPAAQQRTLDALIQNSEEFCLIQDIHKDIKSSVASLSKARDKGKRFRLKEEIKTFRKELKHREMQLSKHILSKSPVVLATLTSAGNAGPLKLLPEEHFDLTVIDECSQGLECACYLSAMKAPKLLIAGDHHQLPPTIMSPEASKAGFLVSLMERVIEMYESRVTRMLTTQYRMNGAIMAWASQALYDGRLEAHSSVADHLLCHMEGVHSNEDTDCAMVLIDTAGCNYEEVSGEDLSKGNEGEASIVSQQVQSLVSSGVKEEDIAVISPYNLQVEMIRTLLRDCHPAVEVRSVDGFQGREKEAILISLVRSNKQGEIGFLGEDRRLNVAVTRARRQVVVVCDSDTVCRHAFIKSLVEHIAKCGLVKSGHEFDTDVSTRPGVPAYKIPAMDSGRGKENKKKDKREGKVKEPLSEEQANARKLEFENKVSDFLADEEKIVLKFPRNLNSFERLLVHDIAEKKGLLHSSEGEGRERFIVLRKKGHADGEREEGGKGGKEGRGEEGKGGKEEGKQEGKEEEKQEDKGGKEEGKQEGKEVEKQEGKGGKEEGKEKGKEEGKEREGEEKNDVEQGSRHGHIEAIQSLPDPTLNSSKEDVKQPSEKDKVQPASTRPKSTNPQHKQTKKQPANKPESTKPQSNGGAPPAAPQPVVPPPPAMKVCQLCRLEVSVRNFDLHLMRCERIKKDREIKAEIDKRKVEIKGAKKKKKKNGETEAGAGKDEDLELMEKFSKENNSCAFPRCKCPSILLLQLCSFCKNNFCLKHHQAEIHGCGDEAKKHARTVLIRSVRNGVLTPGSGVPSKKPDPTKRAHMQRKLEKKLGALENQRATKKKEK